VSPRKPGRLPEQILDEATTWFVEFSEGGVSTPDREAFVAWLRTSPEHVRAYLQVTAHWEDARSLRNPYSIDELISLANQSVNVVTLRAAPQPKREPTESAPTGHRTSGRRGYLWRAGLAASVVVVALIGVGTWFASYHNLYTTDYGEQRVMTLDDGSTVDLNTHTRLRIVYDHHKRNIELLEGQVLFHVVKDPERPFVVRVGDAKVQAIGTQFDVYKKATATVVTVLEGKVAVLTGSLAKNPESGNTDGATAGSQLLGAGEQATVTDQGTRRAPHADISAATAWTRKKIVFSTTPLSEVVAEFNRYNSRKLVVVDPTLNDVRISGVFASTDPASLIRGLDALGRFKISEAPDRIEIAAP
jgi:transmembrane sensor